MAKRTFSPNHDAMTREKIKTSQLINRLMQNANGDIEMTNSQVRSAEILLKKVLPDLGNVTIQGPGADGEFVVRWAAEKEANA